MRIRTALIAAALAAIALVPLTGVASAQPAAGDRDCRDFASQAAAQSALNSRSGDPERLDADGDGYACEEHFEEPAVALGPPTTPVETTPVETPEVDDPEAVEPVVDPAPEPVVVVPPPDAPQETSVRTVPENQILVTPRGAPDTGDGSVAGLQESHTPAT